MKRKTPVLIILIILAAALTWVNRDIFRFEYKFTGERTFDPSIDAKGNYILTEPAALKPGTYELCFYGVVRGTGSSVFLARGDDSEFVSFSLADGTDVQKNEFRISGSTENLRIGINYDPLSSEITSQKISIISGHVLYRESVLRHGTVSLVILLCGLLLLARLLKPGALFSVFPCLRDRGNEQDLLILLLITGILSVPLLLPDSYGLAEDMFFHLSRIEGIAEGIKAGYFPVRDQLFWLKNYGYGAGYFYADPFLYFPAVLRLLGFPPLTSYKIFTVLCTFLSLGTFYLTAKKISGKRTAGLAAAILFGFSPYRCMAVFYRGAVGEMQAFIFLPLVILGLWYMFSGRPDRWWVFAFGFWGLLSTHLISLVLTACFTAVYLSVRIRAILRDRRILFGLVKAVLVTVFLGAGFLLPMMEQMNGNSLNMNILVSSKVGGLTANNISPAKNLLLFFHDWKYDANYSRSLYPGWIFLLIPLLRLILWFRTKKLYPAADTMLLAGLILMICSTDLFPWYRLVWFLNRIQFSWRLLMPVSVLLPLCGGFFLAELFPGKGAAAALIVLAAGCAVIAFPIYRDTIVNRTVSEEKFIMQDNRVAGMEYLPSGLSAEFIDKNRDTVACDPPEIEILSHKRRGLSFTFDFAYRGDAEELVFDIPLIRYHGFRGTFRAADEDPVPVTVGRSDVGLVQVRVKAVPEGTVSVAYHKTNMEKAGEIITILTLLGIMVTILHRKYKRLD